MITLVIEQSVLMSKGMKFILNGVCLPTL